MDLCKKCLSTIDDEVVIDETSESEDEYNEDENE